MWAASSFEDRQAISGTMNEQNARNTSTRNDQKEPVSMFLDIGVIQLKNYR